MKFFKRSTWSLIRRVSIVCVSAWLPQTGNAQSFVYTISGSITSVSNALSGGPFVVDAPISISYTLNPASPDTNPNASIGSFRTSLPVAFETGSLNYSFVPYLGFGFVSVENDSVVGLTTRDAIAVDLYDSPNNLIVNSLQLRSISIYYLTNGSAAPVNPLNTDGQLITASQANAFASKTFTFVFLDENFLNPATITGTFSAVTAVAVPEPSSVALFLGASALIAASFRRRTKLVAR